ncbi:hypothetical protein QFC19_001813 [Naganishia cerealis]|uniref:Uncharacterized protein n=1 Tax=Naganishia cerealis TaxID=610337 RepID=A0ACC2WF42_9TREE|nr:hypothetical protein QFC19_001813 [Naganishia cerealis]
MPLLPAARPIVITYLQECMASNLISATQLVDYVLEYGKAVHEGLKKPELFTSGEDVDRFCEILYEGLPSVVLAQKSSITEGTSMVELLLSLTGMLGDVNEQHPGTCQFFTNSLSVVSERQAWSEIELEALSVFKSSADRLATIPQTILQDIHLVGTLPNVSDSLRLAEGPWASRVPLGADDDEPSLPSSPDPWTISPVAANGQVGDGEILQIRAPPYITLMVKTALETSWGHGFESQTHQGQTIDIPNSYREGSIEVIDMAAVKE